MKLKNMTGYMLGNPNNVHRAGEVWTGTDCRVWVCATLNKAKRILTASQRMCGLEPGCVWTTIYQVFGKNIVCEKGHNGLWYTNTPTKIKVVRVMYNKDVRQITDADLIVNARRHWGRFAQLMLSLQGGNEK